MKLIVTLTFILTSLLSFSQSVNWTRPLVFDNGQESKYIQRAFIDNTHQLILTFESNPSVSVDSIYFEVSPVNDYDSFKFVSNETNAVFTEPYELQDNYLNVVLFVSFSNGITIKETSFFLF